MSMIRIVAHREERVALGFDFARLLRDGETVTGLDALRIERRAGQTYEDVTGEVVELPEGGGLPEYDLQGSMIVLWKRRVAQRDTIQPPGSYLVHIAARTSAAQEPMVLDIDGRVPVLVITDGR